MNLPADHIKCGIHQPNFLPWLGYFYKIAQSDVFIFLDDVQLSKGSYTSRVKIHKSNGNSDGRWMTLPIQKMKLGTPINKVFTSTTLDWPEQMKTKIQTSYKEAPYFKAASKFLDEAFSKIVPGSKVSEMNEVLIKDICTYLGLQTTFRRSSDLHIKSSGQERLIDLVLGVQGNTYLSGMGGHNYLNEQVFEDRGINLIYSDYASHIKGKIPDNFIDKSVISYLFHFSIEEVNAFLAPTK